MTEKLYNLVEKMYIELSGRMEKMHSEFSGNFQKIDQRFEGIDRRFDVIDQRFEGIDRQLATLGKRMENIELKIENDISIKIEALFDGQKQMVEHLNRIEEKVDQHDEIIIKRIK